MLDFLRINEVINRGKVEITPQFIIRKSKDLMIRGGGFYAMWNDEKKLWITDEYEATGLIDEELRLYYENNKNRYDSGARVLYLKNSDNGSYDKWIKYTTRQCPDNFTPLNEKLVYKNSDTNREQYASQRLNYSLGPGDISAYEHLISTLYSEEERHKIEWAIGAIVSGDSVHIQKFIVLYGSAGTGKSTILNIIQDLFEGYYCTFDAKALGSKSDSFALEPFAMNPLVAIQHDGDLSRIEDNTRLNSLVSHEYMTVNAKYKSIYTMRFNSFLFMGTNNPVKITNAKSGLLRRLIDVSPSGDKLSVTDYINTTSKIKFELGAIAYHCLQVYKEDPHAYDHYVPIQMLGNSNEFYNFVFDNYTSFDTDEGVTLDDAWALYNSYCEHANFTRKYSKMVFKEELKNYFNEFNDRLFDGDKNVYNLYRNFVKDIFMPQKASRPKTTRVTPMKFVEQPSLLDAYCNECKAQYANDEGTPTFGWDNVKTKLKDIDTSQLHYVRLPKEHIVIDFDLKDNNGEKSLEKNIIEASKWPDTYAELSKSGAGIHLHYIYDGDPKELSRLYAPDIEIKVFTGKSSLRRKLTRCINKPIATISDGLPIKRKKTTMIDITTIKDEAHLINLVKKGLRKEVHDNTTQSISFIKEVLDKAYNSGVRYDIRPLKKDVDAFAHNSTHQAQNCIKMVEEMKFCSDDIPDPVEAKKDVIVFFDVEVYKNLLIIVWKALGKSPVRMINPTPMEVAKLFDYKLVGFNNRRYDNHIIYARTMGYSNMALYNLSQAIISGNRDAFFGNAYNLSYTDVYDFCSTKQTLKKWELELNIHHQEMDLDWNEPAPEEYWDKIAEYCENDVIATEKVFLSRQDDFTARKILAEMAESTVNDTTNQLTTKIIFGNDKDTESELVYTDLSEMFPGYTFENGKSSYRGEDPGEGGYVYSEPGMYRDVALLDIASMHPTSIEQLNLFGKYTKNFSDIKKARILIKHGEYEEAKKLFGGKLVPYLKDKENATSLAYALKIAINSVYGLTSAKFPNKCRDPKNIDNIVAKRGALFMINLKHEVQNRGYQVAHIKTDSIKIPNADPEIIKFVMDYGLEYGYVFEHEATYSKMCLVNDAVYIAQYKDGKHAGEWTATGAQFAVPFVFKTLFSKEPLEFEDLCEIKTVTSKMYLDMDEDLPEGEHAYRFVGKAGKFCPIKPECGGGILYREKDGKYSAVTGTKGYRWLESEVVEMSEKQDDIDYRYYEDLANAAIDTISKYGDFEMFVND